MLESRIGVLTPFTLGARLRALFGATAARRISASASRRASSAAASSASFASRASRTRFALSYVSSSSIALYAKACLSHPDRDALLVAVKVADDGVLVLPAQASSPYITCALREHGRCSPVFQSTLCVSASHERPLPSGTSARYEGATSMTIEELLDADVLPPQTAAALRERYILG